VPLGIFVSGFAASAAMVAAATDLQPFALVLYAPRIDAIGADLERRGVAPTLLLQDDPGASNAAQEAVLWFRQHAPVVTPV
jgi:hypothetical protein